MSQVTLCYLFPFRTLFRHVLFRTIWTAAVALECLLIVLLLISLRRYNKEYIIYGIDNVLSGHFTSESEETLLDSQRKEPIVISDFSGQKLTLKFKQPLFKKYKTFSILVSFLEKQDESGASGDSLIKRTVQLEKTTAEVKSFAKKLSQIRARGRDGPTRRTNQPGQISQAQLGDFANRVLEDYLRRDFSNPAINELVHRIQKFLCFSIKRNRDSFICSGVSNAIDFPNDFLKEVYLLNQHYPNFYIHKICLASEADRTFKLFLEDKNDAKEIRELQKTFSEIRSLCNAFFERKTVISGFRPASDLLELKYFLNLVLNESRSPDVFRFLQTGSRKLTPFYRKLDIASIDALKHCSNEELVGYNLIISRKSRHVSNSIFRKKEHFIVLGNHMRLKFQNVVEADLEILPGQLVDEGFVQRLVDFYLGICREHASVEFLMFVDYFSLRELN